MKMDANDIDVEAMVAEGLAILDEFEETGDRSGFEVWLDKYSDEIEKRKEATKGWFSFLHRLSSLDAFPGDAIEDEIERIEKELVGGKL